MARYSKKEKDDLIQGEMKRLCEIFDDLPKGKKRLIDGLIEQAAFLRISIDDLQNDINKSGYSVKSPQGVKKRPEADLHISMSKNYQAVIRQLTDLSAKSIPVPTNMAEAEANEEFEKFLNDDGQ